MLPIDPEATTLRNRWQALAAVLFAASSAGTSYAFGLYSNVFKDDLGYSQFQLSIIGSAGATGLYMSVFCGLLLSYTGPAPVLLIGASFIFGGNIYMWAGVKGLVPSSLIWMAMANCCAQIGVACASVTVLTVAVRVFPSEVRGRVAGLGKAYFGISAGVLATIYATCFTPNTMGFLLFVSIVVPIVLTYAAFNVRIFILVNVFFLIYLLNFNSL